MYTFKLTKDARNKLLTGATLKPQDNNKSVLALQEALVESGYGISPDGQYGDNTTIAVKALQQSQRMPVTGVADTTVTQWLVNRPDPRKLITTTDIRAAANNLGWDYAAVMAVTAVESNGSGYFANGKTAILYERHVMYDVLTDHGIRPDPYVRTQPGLVNPKAGGYLYGMREYDRLEKAKEICEDAALESASWGLYQILGRNWHLMGYSSVKEYVQKSQESEIGQLDAFVRFIKSQSQLLNAGRSHDWAKFALYYNGRNYAKNQYDVKLADAYKRFS